MAKGMSINFRLSPKFSAASSPTLFNYKIEAGVSFSIKTKYPEKTFETKR